MDRQNLTLLTDLYELTMMQGYSVIAQTFKAHSIQIGIP